MSNIEIPEQGSGEVIDNATATETGEQGSTEVVDVNAIAATLTIGTYVDYLLVWSAPAQLYYVGMSVPIKFAFSRVDGQALVFADADTLTLKVTLPSGATQEAGAVEVSSLNAASIEIAALYTFAVKDTHVFELTALHDGQEIIARKTLIVY